MLDPFKLTLIIIVWRYFFTRFNHKKIQKKYWLDNFEIWIFQNLIDYYKSKWFPYPKERAMEEILKIRSWININ